jgi:deoxyribonuclease V
MILAVDVDYKGTSAQVGGVSFSNWDDSEPDIIYTSQVKNIGAYESGSFYKRELPCILSLLNEHSLKPTIIIVDGFVYLNGFDKPGLGKCLYDALGGEVAVVGVAKRSFKGITEEFALNRGESENPLYVTAEGMDTNQALELIKNMHGKYRIPSLLKTVDQVCRGKC